MAKFEIVEQEGVRMVKVTLQNETVRTESGALYYMRGSITMESKGPSVGGLLKAFATGESIFRPTYAGTGELFLEPSFGGYHTLEVQDKTWIAEGGAYWASESQVQVEAFREKALTALKTGEGFMDFQTKLAGTGKVVLQSQGPVEVIELRQEKLVVDGKYVLAREASLAYSVTRATKSLLGSMTSGEGLVRTYEGTGTILMAPMPYWRQRLFDALVSAKSSAG
jgi:uncharacterized protein (AIM24 family)